ncbi:MAG: L,D-transpeptidase [Chloroflexota bacterium]|nr:L,D-transpeptidase [Chloroflexota bacterium]
MRRFKFLLSLLVALLVASAVTLWSPDTTFAQGGRMRAVGGYGVVLQNASTYEYGSLDSAVNGRVTAGELVYINGWQIGVYHIGPNRWVAASAVQPIIDANGNPVVNYVTRDGNQYYMRGNAITLPRRHVTEAEKFLANPGNYRVIYDGSYVPEDQTAELVDTSQVWYAPGETVVATMRVTDLYGWIYLRTAPSFDAPRASYNAYAGEILTAYEVRGNWYRIANNVWAPRASGNEVYLVPENITAYAPSAYYNGGKWISVDLNRQRLTAWEGDDVVISSPVKSGKYGYATPTGVYQTYAKIPNERMSGSDYDLKDVAWTQYFTRNAVALHAAYWHHNYNGRPGSHGCVNLPIDKAQELFMWAPLGITVVTHNPYQFDAIDIANASKWSQYER